MTERISILAAIALTAASALAQPSDAADRLEPHDAPLQTAEAELALALARTTINEASFSAKPADLFLTWQVVEGHGRTTEARLAWLRAHSSCVNTDRPRTPAEMRGNCRWSRHLQPGELEPEGWPAGLPWSGWRARVWQRVQQLSLRLVRGAPYPAPCVERPDTWGGRMDRARALERGLRPVVCHGTANAGYRYPGR